MVHALYTQKHETEFHKCNLPGEPWNIIATFIESGLFVNLRRFLKRCMMISTNHPYTRSYAPSINRLKLEEKEHLIENYAIIHPLSMFSLYFNFITCFIFVFYFLHTPILYAMTNSENKRIYIMLPVHVTKVTLIIVTFLTGVYNEKDNTVSMNPGDIAKSYLKSYFFVDVLTPFLKFLGLIIVKKHPLRKTLTMIHPIVVIMRYVRYIWCLQVLKVARLYFGCSITVFRVVKLFLNLCIVNMLLIYILYSLSHRKETYNFQVFLSNAEDIIRMLFLIKTEFNVIENDIFATKIVRILVLIAGFIYHLAILAEAMSIWFKVFRAENNETEIIQSVITYAKYKALPFTLRERICLYLEFKYHGRFYKESSIEQVTTSFLQTEIILAGTKNVLEKVPIFQNVPYSLLRKLRVNLRIEIYLPSDYIIKFGSRGGSMFFLRAGTVLLTSEKGEEICTLRDGSYFGEAGLVINMNRFVNVIAVTPCELFKLKRSDLLDVLQDTPELYEEMENSIANKVSLALRTNDLNDAVIY
ncbi:potassium/sodium hyperpolarization-activated cyclic nucleotide-gated channel 1-like [Anthonomus grandis grandis]|uniref:potassium/sodium hyperpolarization-activated cyclic nucleotide-gated channel 1-like n=1 Tax=Anthonomus grandis grandis TaxID=2921223 RepID=UPI00216615D3|nr:potassium/sodium hyperpolarization-activated cyclic nucleotide-gated channel 1-like [Anthonomus grandis grandis]